MCVLAGSSGRCGPQLDLDVILEHLEPVTVSSVSLNEVLCGDRSGEGSLPVKRAAVQRANSQQFLVWWRVGANDERWCFLSLAWTAALYLIDIKVVGL